MTPGQPAPKLHLTQTADYRENYANSVQMRVSLWDFFVMFGLANPTAPDALTVQNFQGIYLSPQQAKALSNLLAPESEPIRSGVWRDQVRGTKRRARRRDSVVRGASKMPAQPRPPMPKLPPFALMNERPPRKAKAPSSVHFFPGIWRFRFCSCTYSFCHCRIFGMSWGNSCPRRSICCAQVRWYRIP